MSLKVLILGAGAVGGYFGGRLVEAARAGKADVEATFLVRPARARWLAEHGLVVKSPFGGGFTAPVRAVGAEAAADNDLIFLSCKSYDLEPAIEAIAPAVGPQTLILPLLNGLAHFDRLDERFGRERVLGGCCHLVANLEDDGTIAQLAPLQRITYGLRPGNPAHAARRLGQLHAAYRATVVDAHLSEDISQDVWEKYVFLTTMAAATCLMRASVGDILAADGGEALIGRLLAECEAAAAHAGHPSRPEAQKAAAALLTAPGSPLTASMLRDLEAGRRIERDHIVGDMLRRARQAGSDATVLQMAWAHLQARDARLARVAAT